MNVLLERKKYVITLLKSVENHPSTGAFKQEMMTLSYVVVCGAIEFMIEHILHDWLSKTLKHHKGSRYRGKKCIQNFLNEQSQVKQKDIEEFHSTKLSQIRGLINKIAGQQAKDRFNQLFENDQSVYSINPDIDARLERINRTRHDLAHGTKIPNDIQPNIIELREDFLFIYEHLIKNVKKCLPKV